MTNLEQPPLSPIFLASVLGTRSQPGPEDWLPIKALESRVGPAVPGLRFPCTCPHVTIRHLGPSDLLHCPSFLEHADRDLLMQW